MGKHVYANGKAIACKAGDGKVIAAFPDVCMSPPGPPAGPIPVPYPNTSFSKDLKNGSKTVKIGGKPVALKDQSFYKTSPLGNEAATRSFGAAVVTHQITGRTYFAAYSFDVKIEGKNVCRHLDLTTSNHASSPGSTPPMPNAEGMTAPADPVAEQDRCPCCKQQPAHANQKDPETGDMYEPVDEMAWYRKAVDIMDAKVRAMHRVLADNPSFATSVDAKGVVGQQKIDGTLQQQRQTREAYARLEAAHKSVPRCENLHDPPNSDCGIYFVKTHKKPGTSSTKDREELGFKDKVRQETIERYQQQGQDCSRRSPVAHRTPLAAGGCPTGQDNLIPNEVLSPQCQQVDDDQTYLQSIAAPGWRR